MNDSARPPEALFLLGLGTLTQLRLDSRPIELDSRFAEEARARQERYNQDNAWKWDRGESKGFGAYQLWGGSRMAGARARTVFRWVVPGFEPGEILYTLNIGEVGALLRRHPDGRERRLLHRPGFTLEGMACDKSGRMILALTEEGGACHLSLMDKEANLQAVLTTGDCRDGGASFSRRIPGQVLYHSSGMGHTESGQYFGMGPSSLHRIDLSTKETTTILEDKLHDLLHPIEDELGNIWYIRRPWEMGGPGYWAILLQVLLLPWHLLSGIAKAILFFARVRAGDHTVGREESKPTPGVHGLFLGKSLRAVGWFGGAKASIAPKAWVLVRRSPDGAQTVVAPGVVWHGRGASGHFWSDGRKVHGEDGSVRAAPKEGIVEAFAFA